MAQLGINTIYVMEIGPKANHNDCFSIFNATSYEDFARSYTTDFLKGMFEIIDAVKDYDNLMGFDLGVLPNDVGHFDTVNGMTWSDMMKTSRAFVRDTKEYISHNAKRPILVGTDLYLRRSNDQRLLASDLMRPHMHYFTCAIDGKQDDISRSDCISIWNIYYSYMGVFDEADYVEYELHPDLLNDTFLLFNSSSQLIRPHGVVSGGARPSWTNTNMGWKLQKVNWGLTSTAPDGLVPLTANFDEYRAIFDRLGTGSWLDGQPINEAFAPPEKCQADGPEMKNRTMVFDTRSTRTTITMATDWALPTRPPGLDALITKGVAGKRGKMVDVTITAIVHAIRDSKGNLVTDLVLKPSSSQMRSTTREGSGAGTPTTSSSGALSTGGKARIGAGAGVGGIRVAALFALCF
ncbi:hypothetical protein GQ44DRAFT_768647 [Phaeosphaeriaceae sp. PMI808]|nr:hypothetical protein GQ44DRAFT_768647 [Phaeosphaeriaceae sp. PMI808]